MDNQEKTKPGRSKIAIIILAALLILSAGGLAVRYIYLGYFVPTRGTATVPENLIETESSQPEKLSDSQDSGEASGTGETAGSGEVPDTIKDNENAYQEELTGSSGGSASGGGGPRAVKMELYQGNPGDNESFEVQNMLPGDSVTKYFCVKVCHDADITLLFRAEVTEQTKHLGDVLRMKVTHLESGKVLCDAPFSQIDGREFAELLRQNAQEETTAYYRIDVSLDTSVGNEYQAAMLKADFEWYVEDGDGLTPPPKTSDAMNLTLWSVLVWSSFLLLVFLLLGRRGKEDKSHG